MGLLDFFKKKKKSTKQLNQNGIVSSKSNMSNDFVKYFQVHPDIKELIWIENGPKKNFFPPKNTEDVFQIGDFTITFTMTGREEPSLIDMNLEVTQLGKRQQVNSLPYYPTYKELTPQQKYTYWDFLSNPYQPVEDIGYVFILYYGLERHLLIDKYEKAINAIIKLREVHKNRSFQFYSGNAIVLSCMLHQRADIMQVFLESLDQDYKKGFSEKLYLLSFYSFMEPMEAEDVMRLSKVFGFSKTNYIKGYPELFSKTLQSRIIEKFGTSEVPLNQILSNLNRLPAEQMRLFANTSLMDETINFPDITASDGVQKVMFNLLNETHERVKKQLAEMRKNNVAPKREEQPKKLKKPLKFDYVKEAHLLDELKKNKNNPVDKHFVYNQLQDFYYKYRELDPVYVEECIKYCEADIQLLDQLNERYVKESIANLSYMERTHSKEEYKNEVQKVKKQKFQGRIPAFSRLAIIYEKRKDYDSAIKISNNAIEYYSDQGMNTSEFEKRLNRLRQKVKV
ncbi:TerB N-terminal domain-containing protein [Virgibacillus kimchii]